MGNRIVFQGAQAEFKGKNLSWNLPKCVGDPTLDSINRHDVCKISPMAKQAELVAFNPCSSASLESLSVQEVMDGNGSKIPSKLRRGRLIISNAGFQASTLDSSRSLWARDGEPAIKIRLIVQTLSKIMLFVLGQQCFRIKDMRQDCLNKAFEFVKEGQFCD